MGLFTPVKKHPNRFNYTPRYYDPVKEAREQRRRELRGERGEEIDSAVAREEYKPGDYLRRRKAMRLERKSSERSEKRDSRGSMLTLALVATLILVIAYTLGPRIVSLISGVQNIPSTEQGATTAPTTAEEAEFDPYAPIVIVPNDYQE